MLDRDWINATEAVVQDLLHLAEVFLPPVDALHVARRCALLLAWDNAQDSRGRLQRWGTETAILLRHDDRPERVQWAAAHEIGESVAWKIAQRAGAEPEEVSPRQRENLANLFASHLLLPQPWFSDYVTKTSGDLQALKAQFSTASHELIAMRLLDLETVRLITVWDQGRLVRRRSNLPGKTLPLTKMEQNLWQTAHESGTVSDATDTFGRLRIWPIHEPGWKREIGCWDVNVDWLETTAEDINTHFVMSTGQRSSIRSW